MTRCNSCGASTVSKWDAFIQEAKPYCEECRRWACDPKYFKDYIDKKKVILESFKVNRCKSPYEIYCCDNCKYIMFHRLVYCPTCPGKLREDKILAADIPKKYPNFKVGW